MGEFVAKGDRERRELENLKELEARLIAKRAPFSAYLMRHYDVFADVLTRLGPNWKEIAEWAIEMGYGKRPLSGDAARKAFERETARRKELALTAQQKTPAVTSAKREPSLRTPGVTVIPDAAPPKAGTSRMEEVLESMKAVTDYRKKKEPK